MSGPRKVVPKMCSIATEVKPNVCSTMAAMRLVAHHARPIRAITPVVPVMTIEVRVPAGYPSPAQDFRAEDLDLNEHLIRDRLASFIMRVSGDSMIDAGIADGDEIIVDRGLRPKHGDVVVAAIDGEFTIKRLITTDDGAGYLQAENPRYPNLPVGPESDFQIFGVVTRCLHRL